MSAPIDSFAQLLREHGLDLLLGVTIVLGAFALGVRLSRSLPQKHQLAGAAMLAAAGYLLLAVVPLPRFDLAAPAPAPTPTSPAARVADEVAPSRHDRAPARPEPTPRPASPPPARAAEPALVPAATGLVHEREVYSASTAAGAPRASDATTGGVDLAQLVAWALLVGGAWFALHLAVGALRLRRVLRGSRPAQRELVELVELPPRTRLRVARAPVQPFCCGFLRPTIVLPERLATPSDAARFVLLHERAHLRGGDPGMRLLTAALRPLLFWHPLFWWLQHRLRFTGELLADDAAASGAEAAYVRCMLALSTSPDPAAGATLAATIFRRKSELFRRLEMMLQRDETITRSRSPWARTARAAVAVTLVALSAGAFGVERAAAQEPASTQDPGRSRAEVRELRNELARLRAELKALRRVAAGVAESQDPAASPAPTTSSFGGRAHADSIPRASGGGTGGAFGGFPSAGTGRNTTGARATGRGSNNPLANEADAPAPVVTERYTVRQGDTMERIARRHYGSVRGVQRLRRLNPDVDPARLRVGQRLVIEVAKAPPTPPELPGVADVPPTAPTPPGGERWNSAIGLGGGSGGGHAATTTMPEPPQAPAPRAMPPLIGSLLSPNPVASPEPTALATTRTAGSGRAARGRSGSRSELADLVIRCLELRGDVEIAEINVSNLTDPRERDIAKVRLRTKQQQYQALRDMLEQELHAAEEGLSHARKLREKGFVTEDEVDSATIRVNLLRRGLK